MYTHYIYLPYNKKPIPLIYIPLIKVLTLALISSYFPFIIYTVQYTYIYIHSNNNNLLLSITIYTIYTTCVLLFLLPKYT